MRKFSQLDVWEDGTGPDRRSAFENRRAPISVEDGNDRRFGDSDSGFDSVSSSDDSDAAVHAEAAEPRRAEWLWVAELLARVDVSCYMRSVYTVGRLVSCLHGVSRGGVSRTQ